MKRQKWETNRQFTRRPKQGSFWCVCDLYLLRPCEKCPVCKRKDYGRKRDKR